MSGKPLAISLFQVLATPLLAQATWIVDAAGGPGVHFTDLPSAVASATVADGDTILVRTGPFGEGATPFTTSKGLTIVGVGGAVPILTSSNAPIEVSGLPAGSTFRISGFSRVADGELNIRLLNCAGQVHLDALRAREPDMFFPAWPAITVLNCSSVTMRDVGTFGAPAVRIDTSTVALVSCQLGRTYIGVGGGRCVEATNATVDVVQPVFDPTVLSSSAIEVVNTVLRIAGDGSALVASGTLPGGTNVPIVATGGSVTIDPAVPLTTFPVGQPPVAGTAVVTFASVPGSWLPAPATPGQPLLLLSTAPPGAAVFQTLGAPGPLTPSPFGLLGVDTTRPFGFFPVAIAPLTGLAVNQVLVPAVLPLGQTFASQSVVWDGVALRFGAPVAFTVH